MTSPSDSLTLIAGEVVPGGEGEFPIFYVAPEGHKYEDGQTFTNIDTLTTASKSRSYLGQHWVALKSDGSREVVGHSEGMSKVPERYAKELQALYPDSPIHAVRFDDRDYDHIDKKWIGYDWAWGEEEVNQVPKHNEWAAHVGRFAHGFDTLEGFKSFTDMSESDKEKIYRIGHTLAGDAWFRLTLLRISDPTTSDQWKALLPWVKVSIDVICGECSSETFARAIAMNVDIAAFTAKLHKGMIHGTDRSSVPWQPGVLLVQFPEQGSTESLDTALTNYVLRFKSARDYYDRHVSHAIIPHDH